MTDQRRAYLVSFLRGCAGAADDNQLHVDLGRLLVNGDLMREAADLLEASTTDAVYEPPPKPELTAAPTRIDPVTIDRYQLVSLDKTTLHVLVVRLRANDGTPDTDCHRTLDLDEWISWKPVEGEGDYKNLAGRHVHDGDVVTPRFGTGLHGPKGRSETPS